jgi:hypothetical protein
MSKLLELLEDSCGNLSSMRIMNFLIIGVVLYKYITTGSLTENDIFLIGVALTGKVIQKQIEEKNKKSSCAAQEEKKEGE